ncbi:MAG TPA: hypothetical protein DIU15_18350 [Deltaproteobacteria bacterium]|nr:hypothetical protein [Deltaproteobacteria bacterium]
MFNGGADIVTWSLQKGTVTPSTDGSVFLFNGGGLAGVMSPGTTLYRELQFLPQQGVQYTAVVEFHHDGVNEDGTLGSDGPATLAFEGLGVGASEIDCEDGVDNDGDALVDCLDTADCATDPACGGEICDSGLDEDGDLLTDCDDPDCNADPSCVDFCCSAGSADTNSLCLNAAARICVCTDPATGYCCVGGSTGAWDQTCIDTYSSAACGATCPAP